MTESDEHWVRGTAELLLPGPAATLLKGVEVVCSKQRFGKEFPGQKACWQIAAFSYVTNRHLLGAGRGGGAVGVDGGAGGGREQHGMYHTSGVPERSGRDFVEGSGGAGGVIGSDRIGNGNGNNGCGDILKGGCDAGAIVAVTTETHAREDKSAMRTLRDHHPRIVVKTVSLIRTPTPQELSKQLDLLSGSFAWMFGHPRRAPTSSVPSIPPSIASSGNTVAVSGPAKAISTVAAAGAIPMPLSPSTSSTISTTTSNISTPTTAPTTTNVKNVHVSLGQFEESDDDARTHSTERSNSTADEDDHSESE